MMASYPVGLRATNSYICVFFISLFLKAHEACGPLEIDSALKTVQTLKCELQDAKMSVIDSQLKPLPGESVRPLKLYCKDAKC